MSGASKYEWWRDNRAGVVAHSYGDLACYPNDRGDVVLKQMDDMSDDDQTVIVPIDSAERMAAAILRAPGRPARVLGQDQSRALDRGRPPGQRLGSDDGRVSGWPTDP